MNTKNKYDHVNAKPVKSFFVTMLTRDIELPDAILDLLDNCVDGILRNKIANKSKSPYGGKWAKITFDKSSFMIEDNCGGIPWDLNVYAFRMGRDPNMVLDKNIPTVGQYGIGMKRAIFKMGSECLISTKNKEDKFEVEITNKWIKEEDNWTIPVNKSQHKFRQDGTCIIIGDLHKDIAMEFDAHDNKYSFQKLLIDKISSHYARIIEKGFSVEVNNIKVKPRVIKLQFDSRKNKLKPFIYKSKIDGVDIFFAIGITKESPSIEDINESDDVGKYSSQGAGISIICNDRVVLHCDKSELTGWGEAGIPRYHTQFISISGIVELTSNDAAKLPTTTTKRGIDAGSLLYLKVKNKVREGLRLFTNYTNKWKDRANKEEERILIKEAEALTFDEIKQKVASKAVTLNKVVKNENGNQLLPSLPSPKSVSVNNIRIIFERKKRDIEKVAHFLYGDADHSPKETAEYCFDIQLNKASK